MKRDDVVKGFDADVDDIASVATHKLSSYTLKARIFT